MLDFIFTSAQWFELIKSLITGVVAVYIGYRFALRSKSKEIRLASYYKERIEAVRVLYGFVSALDESNKELFSPQHLEWAHTSYKTALLNWLNSFEQVYQHYNKNRILLIEESRLNEEFRSKLEQLSLLKSLIYSQQILLVELEVYYEGILHGSFYTDVIDEQDKVATRFEGLKKQVDNMIGNDLFNTLRVNLEVYFKELTS